jgi:hypothetical protein
MFLRGLFSFRGCAQVACEVRACLNLVTEGKQTAAWTRDRNYDNRLLDDDLLPPDLNAERGSSNALPSSNTVIYYLVLWRWYSNRTLRPNNWYLRLYSCTYSNNWVGPLRSW